MKRVLVFGLLLALAACGGRGGSGKDENGDGIDDPANPLVPDSVTTVAPSAPKGTVSGRVTDMAGKPLASAEVTVSITDASSAALKGETDANGLFSVKNLPAGSTVGVLVSMAGYAPAFATATIPVAAGNFPLNNGEAFVGTLALLPTSGSVTFNVIGYDGTPIDGTATLDVSPGYAVNKNGAGDIVVTGTITAGVLTFSGVPKIEDAAWMDSAGVTVNYSVYVNPVLDANGVGYSGHYETFTAKTLLTQTWNRTLKLEPASNIKDELAIIATNVRNLMADTSSPASDNLIAKNGTIYVAFNQPIGRDLFVEVRNDNVKIEDSEKDVIGTTVTMNALGTELQIAPKSSVGFSDGLKYNLVIQASSRDNPAAGTKTFAAPFFGGDTTPKSLSNPVIDLISIPLDNETWETGETISIKLDKYIGHIDGAKPYLPIYFNNDLNNRNDVGDVQGEMGSNNPICVPGIEEVPGFYSAKASGYAKQFDITPAVLKGLYTGTSGLDSSNILITIAFSEAFKCPGGGLSSVWGEAIYTTKFEDIQITNVIPVPEN
ncbi:MAG: carboxypeptidase-like regulatory domain-containing protein [Myxococcales bacterium]